MKSKVKGFSAYEDILVTIVSYDFGGYTPQEASRRVRAGLNYWALCGGGVLRLVPLDYELGMWESLLMDIGNGYLETVE